MDKHLLLQAASEIRQLRRVNEVLQAKVDTMDILGAMLLAAPPRQGRGVVVDVDIAWKLEQVAETLDAKEGN